MEVRGLDARSPAITFLDPAGTIATRTQEAIRQGNVDTLLQLFIEQPDLAFSYIGDASEARSLLHVATDWPGHIPNGPMIIKILIKAGARPNAAFIGRHAETPLHWAASSDDVAALDMLLDLGADIEAPGGVISSGTPLADARAFLQMRAAHRLVQRGASVDVHDAATLGLLDRLEHAFAGEDRPDASEVDMAFWNACHGGQLPAAQFLHRQRADVNYVPPWDPKTPLGEARRGGHDELVAWLESVGAR